MIKWKKLVAATLIAAIVTWANTAAQPVVNEVLANEPGSHTSLEWIELYNSADSAVALEGMVLEINGSTSVALPESMVLAGGGHGIVCRRLYTEGSSIGFEEAWGDNSGFWGDDESEQQIGQVIEAAFALTNTAGSVALVDNAGVEISRLTWEAAGADGCSWERVIPESDSVAQCVDPLGSTPGSTNSVTPLPNDLALRLVAARALDGMARIEVEVANNGTTAIATSILSVKAIDGNDTLLLDSTIISALPPGERRVIDLGYTFTATYTILQLDLPPDDRPANNRIAVVAPGGNYPPLVLSEFLANPGGALESEWIELYNRSDTAVDLYGWHLGDSRTLVPLSDDSGVTLAPHSYLIAVDDSAAFTSYYLRCDVPIVEPTGWPTLNNGGDSVRLVGPFEIEADRFAYTSVFDNNHTWCRNVESASGWGRSQTEGGTPGGPNSVTNNSDKPSLGLTISPRIFSPDGDGRDDRATITVAPDGMMVTLRIFDRQGRAVKVFESVVGSAAWDGRTDSGRRLPIGLYVVVAESETGSTARETMVIAR